MSRVVIAQRDPFAEVAGRGIAELEQSGMEVEVGLLEADARQLDAPYLKHVETGRPWIIAKWAMTLDGKISTRTGESRWISGEASREVVHRLRGRVDGILIGRGTAAADDPLLTARPPGPRTAARIVLDSEARLAADSQLAATAHDAPVIVAVGPESSPENRQRLIARGCEVLVCAGSTRHERLLWLLDELGRRRMTNVLVEGGSELFGSFFEIGQIDEVHVFIAPKLIGGRRAPSAVGGEGLTSMADAWNLSSPQIRQCGTDVHVHGRIAREMAK